MKFRKKPVTIDAWPVKDLLSTAKRNWSALPSAITDAYKKGKVIFLPGGILIETLEGEHKANYSDWIIKGERGELYPCKPDIFMQTYEPADEDRESGV